MFHVYYNPSTGHPLVSENPPSDKPYGFLVEVNTEMIKAGIDELKEFRARHEEDDAYIVTSIYMAMEYQRLYLAGELPDSFNYLTAK
jgi:hypothetical protein